VAVEKLLTSKIAKIKLRQDALGSIYSGRVDPQMTRFRRQRFTPAAENCMKSATGASFRRI
jgi:hypothetical protein